MIYAALILLPVVAFVLGMWRGEANADDERDRREGMSTTSRERYRLFEICTVQRVDGSWSVQWQSTWHGPYRKFVGASSGGAATMALAVERARSVVDAYWECEAEEHWADLVERGYVGLEG